MQNGSIQNLSGNLFSDNKEHQEELALKKALEWELSLDSKDLRSHAWYHGPLPRHLAEEILQREEEFLIRDCSSQPDNYVLSCRTDISVLHFVINKIVLQPDTIYERIQYQFEDDAFDTVPDLITFYVCESKLFMSLLIHTLFKYTFLYRKSYFYGFRSTYQISLQP